MEHSVGRMVIRHESILTSVQTLWSRIVRRLGFSWGTEPRNLLMSLPTSLIHCLLSDWVTFLPLMVLEIALCINTRHYKQLLDMYKSPRFFIKKLHLTTGFNSSWEPPPEHLSTQILAWLMPYQLKVLDIELHERCLPRMLRDYLQKFGSDIRHISAPQHWHVRSDDCLATQNFLIANYCRNLISCHIFSDDSDGSILRILANNRNLEKLHIMGDLYKESDLIKCRSLNLPRLKQLKWVFQIGDEFGKALIALTKTAPNMLQLSIYCYPFNCFSISGWTTLEVARACPLLRTFSCRETHIELEDKFLKQFLTICNNIVNLDLRNHNEPTDTILIEAPSELTSLYCLDLRGCCKLTDRTLAFLALRFAGSLRVLYLDHSMYPPYDDNDDEEEYQVVNTEERGGYTAAGVASLRVQSNHLHTFHYFVEAGTVTKPRNIDALRSATVVHLRTQSDAILAAIAAHCQKMQVLTMTAASYGGARVWLTVDQLMTFAARCSQLCMVVNQETSYFGDFERLVDYTAVQEAFPKLRFVESMYELNFDILKMPV